MKVTKKQLKQLIQEELENLNEASSEKDIALNKLSKFVIKSINANLKMRDIGWDREKLKANRAMMQASYAEAMRELAEQLEAIRGYGAPM